jgi:DNA-binding CsgD family transcriptional regulator/tetratricopeptide (TPR) repeat protein
MGIGHRMSVAASGRARTLVERDESLAVLNGLLPGVRSGSAGRLVLVGGEAGVGKTALLRGFCEAQAMRMRILWGACEPLRTPRPLGPLVDVGEAIGGELRELVMGAARPYEVAVALLGELRVEKPTVLVLEDVHWADEATLDVLVALAARVGSVPALVLASYRSDELERSPQLRFVLGELVPGPDRLTVEPLSEAGVVVLAEPHGIDGRELYRRTGGNPFFVTEVLATGGAQLPETVRDAVLARAARLSAPARRFLDAVAVVPGRVELWLLEALAGELDDRLDECLVSGVLIAGRSHVSFRHELARLAIEEAIAPNRRLALHRSAIAALEARGEDCLDFPRLAYHAEAADDVERVLRWAPRAAESAARSGAPREAAAQYARALRFAEALPADRRAELLRRRADECFMTDQFAQAVEAEQQAIESHRQAGDRLGEGDALRSLSTMLRYLGRTREAREAALEAVRMLEPIAAGRELALAYCNVSYLSLSVENADDAVKWATRALELAQRAGDGESLVYALTNLAVVAFRSGEPDGQLKLEHALELAQRHGLEEYAGRVFANLVLWPLRHRMFALAETYLEAGLQYCGDHGLDTWRLYLLACRARLELDLGRWDKAADSAALVLRDPRSAPVPRGWALAALGLLLARRGDPEGTRLLEEARVLGRGTGELQRIAPAAAASAEAAWLLGENAMVEHMTDPAITMAVDLGVPWVAAELAYWRWQAGLRDELPISLRANPYARSIAGHANNAAELWREIGCPYETALALAESHDEATARQAIEQLQQLGARPAAAIVARRLRERGVRVIPRGPRPQTRENPAGLTARELEVLALLADGLRNAQIAHRLVVSKKTVDHHVSAILRKLDVHTRGEAGAQAIRLGIVSPDTADILTARHREQNHEGHGPRL